MNRLSRIILAVLLGSFLSFGQASSVPTQTAPLKALPDLQVEKIEFSSAPNPGGGTRLTIYYTFYNDSNIPSRNAPTAAGLAAWTSNGVNNLMFQSSIDYRDYPNGRYQSLSELGLELGPHGRAKCNAVLIVPAGGRREFRVRADCRDWISESNETNNEKTSVWPALGVPLPQHK
jgi:hypothetical protein